MPKVNGLTQKQKNFCNLVVNGYTYTDAYFTAYDVKNKETAMVEGSKLMLKEEIREYINTLNKPKEELAILNAVTDREKQIQYIKKRIAICEKMNDENSIIRYTDQLNKIYGVYKAENDTQNEENKLDGIDTTTLQKIALNA